MSEPVNLVEFQKQQIQAMDSVLSAARVEARARAELVAYDYPYASCETCGDDHGWDAVYYAHQEALGAFQDAIDALLTQEDAWTEILNGE